MPGCPVLSESPARSDPLIDEVAPAGKPVATLSSLGLDPQQVPVIDDGERLPAVAAARCSPDALRRRFADPPEWLPELAGDARRTATASPLRDAAVLIPIVLRADGPTVLLTQRTAHLSRHAGQVAFPGGRRDPDDASVQATALRETEEEVGLSRDHIEIIGHLPEYLTVTGYRVTPVVGLVRPDFTLTLQAFEVAEAFEVPLAFLMDPVHHQKRRWQSEAGERTFYAMPYRAPGAEREFFIWGATAAMLRNFYRFLSA